MTRLRGIGQGILFSNDARIYREEGPIPLEEFLRFVEYENGKTVEP